MRRKREGCAAAAHGAASRSATAEAAAAAPAAASAAASWRSTTLSLSFAAPSARPRACHAAPRREGRRGIRRGRADELRGPRGCSGGANPTKARVRASERASGEEGRARGAPERAERAAAAGAEAAAARARRGRRDVHPRAQHANHAALTQMRSLAQSPRRGAAQRAPPLTPARRAHAARPRMRHGRSGWPSRGACGCRMRRSWS
jgi:hypothetical protein